MIGLRPEFDRGHPAAPLAAIAAGGGGNHPITHNNHKKSYRFAGQLSGRFFVAGVSGSFKKHAKQLEETDKKYLTNTAATKKYSYEPVLEKKQKDELRQEAERLLAMEEQLQEIQRMKELKRQRERQRRLKKIEFHSAVRIQLAMRRFLSRRRVQAADVMVDFLRSMAAAEAIAAAAWASSVLRRFAVRCCRIWRYEQWRRQQIKLIAKENWQVITEVAAIWTQARRKTADECIFYCFKAAKQQAVEQILINEAEQEERRRFKLLKSQKRQQRSNKKNWYSDKSKHKDSHLQFFLTEFDSGGVAVAVNGDDHSALIEEDLLSCDSDDALSITALRNKYYQNEHSKKIQSTAASMKSNAMTSEQGSTAVTTNEKAATERKAKKAYDDAVKEKHQRRMQQMEDERRRRMKELQEEKARKVKLERIKRQSEEEAKVAKERHKEAFMAQLAAEQQTRAKLAAKLRAEKEARAKQAVIEEKQIFDERSCMLREDKPPYCYVCLRPPTSSRGNSRARSATSRNSSNAASSRAPSAKHRDQPLYVDPDWTEIVVDVDKNPSHALKKPKERKANSGVEKKLGVAAVVDKKEDHIEIVIDKHRQQQTQKRPHVPRLSAAATGGEISKAKQLEIAERQRVEAELQRLEEERKQKYISAEAVERSRAAVRRRVALRAKRKADSEKLVEDELAARRERMEQIAAKAQMRLQKDREMRMKKKAAHKKAVRKSIHEAVAAAADSRADTASEAAQRIQAAAVRLMEQYDDHDDVDEEELQEAEQLNAALKTLTNSLRLNAEREAPHVRPPTAPGDGQAADEDGDDEKFEYAHITSAHETYDNLLEDFEAEDFLQQDSLIQLYSAALNTAQELAAKATASADAEGDANEESPTNHSPDKDEHSTPQLQLKDMPGETKQEKLEAFRAVQTVKALPSNLKETPYFNDFKKHAGKRVAKFEQHPAAKVVAAVSAHENKTQQTKKNIHLPQQQQQQQLKGRNSHKKQQLQQHAASHVEIDEDLLEYKAKLHDKPGKVENLLSMVSKARKHLQQMAEDSGTDSDAAMPRPPSASTSAKLKHNHVVVTDAEASAVKMPAAVSPEKAEADGTVETKQRVAPKVTKIRGLPAHGHTAQRLSENATLSNAIMSSLRKNQPNIPLPAMTDGLTSVNALSAAAAAAHGAVGGPHHHAMTSTLNPKSRSKGKVKKKKDHKQSNVGAGDDSGNESSAMKHVEASDKKNIPRSDRYHHVPFDGDDDGEQLHKQVAANNVEEDEEDETEQYDSTYEQKLQAEYQLLRQKFNAKIQHATSSVKNPTTTTSENSNSTSAEAVEAPQQNAEEVNGIDAARRELERRRHANLDEIARASLRAQRQSQLEQRNVTDGAKKIVNKYGEVEYEYVPSPTSTLHFYHSGDENDPTVAAIKSLSLQVQHQHEVQLQLQRSCSSTSIIEGTASEEEEEVIQEGSVLEAYAVGTNGISTKDLLRMWELEDAADAERQQQEEAHEYIDQKVQKDASVDADATLIQQTDATTADDDVDFSISASGEDSTPVHSIKATLKEKETDQNLFNDLAANAGRKDLQIDDAALDAECMDFMLRMSQKLK